MRLIHNVFSVSVFDANRQFNTTDVDHVAIDEERRFLNIVLTNGERVMYLLGQNTSLSIYYKENKSDD